MSHDNVVSRALEGSFRKRERRTGKEKKRTCRKVGGLEKRKEVVRTVLKSGQGCNRSNFVFILKCSGRVSV